MSAWYEARRPRHVLDGCGGAGGAAHGYADAGFEVTGVDSNPRLRDAYLRSGAVEFICADILEVLADASFMARFDFAHCSFPCQPHTDLKHAWNAHRHADLIPPGRELLKKCGRPYVIENVPGAGLVSPVTLCGDMFGLGTPEYRLARHREFEASFPLAQPADRCRQDTRPVVGIYGGKVRNRRAITTGSQHSRVGTTLPLEIGQQAMGIGWMNGQQLSQAIPPAYARWIAEQWMAAAN